MSKPAAAALLAAVLASAASAAAEQGRREQQQAFAAVQAGQLLSLHQIEARVVPRMAGYDYLGPEFDASSGIYRLKFMRAGAVMWVDVDARSGAILGRSGD